MDSPFCGECSHGVHIDGRCWFCWLQKTIRPHPTCYAVLDAELKAAIA